MSEERPSKFSKTSSGIHLAVIADEISSNTTETRDKIQKANEDDYLDYIANIPEMLANIKSLFRKYYPAGRIIIDTDSYQQILFVRLSSINSQILKLHDFAPLFRLEVDGQPWYIPKSSVGYRAIHLRSRLFGDHQKALTTAASTTIVQTMKLLKQQAKIMYQDYFSHLHKPGKGPEREQSGVSIYDLPVEVINMIIEYFPKADPYLPSIVPRLSKWFNQEFGDPISIYQSYLTAVEDMKFNLLYNLSTIYKLTTRPETLHEMEWSNASHVFGYGSARCRLNLSHFAGRTFKCGYTQDGSLKVSNTVYTAAPNEIRNSEEITHLSNILTDIGKRSFTFPTKDKRLIDFGSNIVDARRAVEIIMDYSTGDEYDRCCRQVMIFELEKAILVNSNEDRMAITRAHQKFSVEGHEFYILAQAIADKAGFNRHGNIHFAFSRLTLDRHVGDMMARFHSGEYKPSLFYTTTACPNPYTVWFKGSDEFDWYKFNTMLGFYTSYNLQDCKLRGAVTEHHLKWRAEIDMGWRREDTVGHWGMWSRDNEIKNPHDSNKQEEKEIPDPYALSRQLVEQNLFVTKSMLTIGDALEFTAFREVTHMKWIRTDILY